MRLETLDDGTKLEAAWSDALTSSLAYFRALLASSGSSSWKPVKVLPLTASSVAHDDGHHGTSIGRVTAGDVAVHRRSGKSGEVYRAVVEVECGGDISIDTFKGCLVTSETRPNCESRTRDSTDDRGPNGGRSRDSGRARRSYEDNEDKIPSWLAVKVSDPIDTADPSPRDAVTISKTLVDQYTLVDISTSLPRSRHEPAYLRPAPPFVRAHVSLLAWCIQLPSSNDLDSKARITCFWSWNPKGAWAVGGGVPQHLPSLMVGLVDYVAEGSDKVPLLNNYGPDISISSVEYDTARVTLSVGYAVVNSGQDGEGSSRQTEFSLSSTQSWDVQIHVKTQQGQQSSSTEWSSFVGQMSPISVKAAAPKRLVLRFAHAPLLPDEELVRVKVSIERTTSVNPGIRINGIPVTIERMPARPPKRPLLDDAGSSSAISLRTLSTVGPMTTDTVSLKREGSRTAAAEKSIASLIRRNYIYFTSLLQEPEAKWRPVLDNRGVAIHQLDSIDKTLVVFRAEAVFVGVSIWDLYATIANPGARSIWDKSHDEASLVEDVNELTDLWHFRSKAAWPVAARDSVMLRTTYKSLSSVHIFGFSVEDTDLFPRIPPSIDPVVIRTQVDLQGWSIESLSPNTTQVTLLEQSDPRGWSNKSSIPQVMMSTLAGIGEFAIKHGAPPIATRLGGARAVFSKYDVEKESYRFEYEANEARRSGSSSTSTAFPLPVAVRAVDENSDSGSLKSLPTSKPALNLECEIRCDADQWSNSYSIVIDPPHASISALRRHKLSQGGGGLWLTIEHNPLDLGSDRVVVTVRRGAVVVGGKTSVIVNGSKIKVDSEDLPETDVKLLKKQKRARPTRAPLDQPAALGTLRKKQSTLDMNASSEHPRTVSQASSYSRLTIPLAKWYNVAAESTRSAIIPMPTQTSRNATNLTPVDAAVQALGQLTRMHGDRDGESTDPHSWQQVSDRDGLKVEKKVVNHISDTFPVFRAGRIIEGFTAEEVSATVSMTRKDERFEKAINLESYGMGIYTSHTVAHTTFPFRDRSVLLANIVARLPEGPPPSPSVVTHSALSTILHASTSAFDPATTNLDPAKYNPADLPPGKVILEGWILETVDPYSHEQYAIPSTRCLYVVVVDFGGSMPFSVNNMLNAALPRSILAVQAKLSSQGPPSRPRLPAPTVLAPDSTSQPPWALDGLGDERMGVGSESDDTRFTMTVIVQPTSKSRDSDSNLSLTPALRHTDSRVSVNSARSTVIDLAEEIRRGRKDLVVLEVEIGSRMAKEGCDIKLVSQLLPAAQTIQQGSASILPLRLSGVKTDLPFKLWITALAPSVLQSASLDPGASARHLLRVVLPTSGFEQQVDDPLSGRTPPLPRPRWLLDLLNDGAVVELSLSQRDTVGYRYLDEELPVEEDKKLVGTKDVRAQTARLVNHSLATPLAVAKEFAARVDKVTTAPVEVDISEPIEEPAPAEVKVSSYFDQANPQPRESDPMAPTTSDPKRYSFWKYPKLGFSNSAPHSLTSSPVKTHVATLPEVKLDVEPESSTIAPPSAVTEFKLLQPVISLPSLIVACLVCLLLGSLFRSLLSEADYVIYQPPGGVTPPGEHWRELKRIIEWRIGWNRDLIIAVARRR